MKTATSIKRVILPAMMLIVTALSAWGKDMESYNMLKDSQLDEHIEMWISQLNSTPIDSIDYPIIAKMIAELYIDKEDYEKAINYYNVAINTCEKIIDKDDIFIALMLEKQGECYYYVNKYDIAKATFSKTLKKCSKAKGEACKSAALIMRDMGVFYSSPISDYSFAITCYEKAIEKFRETNEDNSNYISKLSTKIGKCYEKLGNYDKAIIYYSQAKENYNSMVQIFKQYYDKHDYLSALNYGEAILDIMTDSISDLATSILLINIADCYYHIFETSKAHDLFSKGINAYISSNGEENPTFALMLSEYADTYKNDSRRWQLGLLNDNDDEAIKLYSKAIEIYNKTNDNDTTIIAILLTKIGDCFNSKGEYKNAIDYYNKAKNKYKDNHKQDCYDAIQLLTKIGDCYNFEYDYYKAIDSYYEAYNLFIKTQDENSTNAAEMLINIGYFYVEAKAYNKAEDIFLKAVHILLKNDFFKAHHFLERAMNYLKTCYYNLNEHQKYLDLLLNLQDFYTKALGENNGFQSFFGAESGMCYIYLHEYDKAKDLILKTIETIDNDEDSYYYKSLLESAGNIFLEQNELNKAIEFYLLDIEKNNSETDENDKIGLALLFMKIGFCYDKLGNNQKSTDYYMSAKQLFINEKKEDLYEYGLFLQVITYHYCEMGNYDEAYSYIKKALDVQHPYVLNAFSSLDSDDRTLYWENFSNEYQSLYPFLSFYNKEQADIGDLYNKSALFAKGLLLNADEEIQQLILDSNNNDAITKNYELKEIRNDLKKLYEIPENIRIQETEPLELKAKKIEQDLMYDLMRLNSFKNFMQNILLTWQDIQKSLKDRDSCIAIEFLSFPNYNSDSTMYIALSVRPGYDQPHMTILCEENDINPEKAYTTYDLSKQIWEPLANELKDVDTIYFSPSGILHTINIESMPHWESKDTLMCNKYKIFRLSSTRELAMNRNSLETNGTELFGGIRYDCDIDGITHQKPDSTKAETTQKQDLQTAEGVGAETQHRGESSPARSFDYAAAGFRDDTQWDYLSGTLTEVNSIKDLLGMNAEKHTACNATETLFKNLSGQKKKTIHIATHGFYWNDSTAREKSLELQPQFLRQGGKDNAMTRTGLLFSGGENAFKKDVYFLPGYDDGVLTAKEVSNLDLRGLELVVLSACQTGLGDIVGSEGVFGLQRGFKKAGAQSIIMSLWNADDDATKDMMTFFYTHLNEMGMDHKHKAFLAAQNDVKKIDDKDGYSYWYKDENNIWVKCNSEMNVEKYKELRSTRPHWATFILLDAIEKPK